MAIYHFASKVVAHPYKRAAYNARDYLADPEGNRSVQGLDKEQRSSPLTKNRRSKKPQEWNFLFGYTPAVWSAILSGDPKDLPPEGWANSAVKNQGTLKEYRNHLQTLVDKVAEKETTKNRLFRKNAQFFREIVVSLPHELSHGNNHEENIALISDFVNKQFVDQGMIAIVDIHKPDPDGDERNIHAHILLTMRSIDQDGFGPKNRAWNDSDLFKSWRANWATAVADRLQAKRLEVESRRFRVAHLTLGEQHKAAVKRRDMVYAGELDRPPTRYKGVVATLRQRAEEKTLRIINSFDATAEQLLKLHERTERVAQKLKTDFVAARTAIGTSKTIYALRGSRMGPTYHAVRRRILEKLLADYKASAKATALIRKPLSIVFYGAAELLLQRRSSLPRIKPPAPPTPVAPPPAIPPAVGGGGPGGGASLLLPHEMPGAFAEVITALGGGHSGAGGIIALPLGTMVPVGTLQPTSHTAGAEPLATAEVPSGPAAFYIAHFKGGAPARTIAPPAGADLAERPFVMEATIPRELFQMKCPTTQKKENNSWGHTLINEFGYKQFKALKQELEAHIEVHRVASGAGMPEEYRMVVSVTTPAITAERYESLVEECASRWTSFVREKLQDSGLGGEQPMVPERPMFTAGPIAGAPKPEDSG